MLMVQKGAFSLIYERKKKPMEIGSIIKSLS